MAADGTLDVDNSKDAGTVTKVGTFFCFAGISFDPRGGLATIDTVGSASQRAQFGLGTSSGVCPAGTQAHVYIAPTAAPFYVMFYR